jgi:hypothetical protein
MMENINGKEAVVIYVKRESREDGCLLGYSAV